MNADHLALVCGDFLAVLSALIATAFVVLYWATARWWRSEMGRNVMALMGSLALLLDLTAVRAFTQAVPAPHADWFLWVRLGVFAFIPVAIGWRLWILVRLQILDPEDRERGSKDV